MNRFALTLLAGTAALGLAASAFAQAPVYPAPAQGQNQAPAGAAAGANIGLGAEANVEANDFGQLIASLNGLATTTTSIAAITTAPANIEVVDVATLTEGANAEAFTNALDRNETQVADLRTALDANATLKAALEAQSVNLNEVVAIDIAANGDLVVYTQATAP
jgi:hypothetical protein